MAGNGGVHEGHRQRMKERFEKNGFTGFSQHEILEMLLYYTYPRIDTNEIAHSLIDKFGSLAGVFDAPLRKLAEDGGVSYNTAVMLKMIPESMRVYYKTHLTGAVYDTTEKLKSFFTAAFTGVTAEEFRVACFDNDMRITESRVIARGTVSDAPISMHKLMETVISANSAAIAIAHNHPSGTSAPSDKDIFATRRVIELMGSVGVSVTDHIIVGADGTYSMRDSSALNIFDR